MTTEEKGKLIGNIVAILRFTADQQNKPFDEGDTFFSLCFKSDDEIKKIARLCGA